MARIFISHSSVDDHVAVALVQWLHNEGWVDKDDVFLDISATQGIAAGEHWVSALETAQTRCEAVIFLVSKDWLSSDWCREEYIRARELNKALFAVIIDDTSLDTLQDRVKGQWQIISLFIPDNSHAESQLFVVEHPINHETRPIRFEIGGLLRLKRGLQRCEIRPDAFDLAADTDGPMGWRAPYRGLEPLDQQDAGVLFGRDADLLRALDTLRRISSTKLPGFMVILGASGAGKSSFLRAGLLPRLKRDDRHWLPLNPIRVAQDDPFNAKEGLIESLRAAFLELGHQKSRIDLRQSVANPRNFTATLQTLSSLSSARLLGDDNTKLPTPIITLDQAEELFSADASPATSEFLKLLEAALTSRAAICIATIRSDSYNLLQTDPRLESIPQTAFNLPPIAMGELSSVINGPAQFLRNKAGLGAPLFSADVSDALMSEIAYQDDALPLLAFTLSRLMYQFYGRDTTGENIIGVDDLAALGGVTKTIETEADLAFQEATKGQDERSAIRTIDRLFIPHLARINNKTRKPERRISRVTELDSEGMQRTVAAFVDRRLLTVKGTGATRTVEVSHEALLRQWPLLASLLETQAEDLLRLDNLLRAGATWAASGQSDNYIDHRGSRLTEALLLRDKSPQWQSATKPAGQYLARCQALEKRAHQIKRGVLASVIAGALFVSLAFGIQQRNSFVDQRALSLQSLEDQSRLLASIAETPLRAQDYTTALNVVLESANHDDGLDGDRSFASAKVLKLLNGLTEYRHMPNNEEKALAIAFSEGSSFYLTSHEGGSIRVWHTEQTEAIQEIEHPSGVAAKLLTLDSKSTLFASVHARGKVDVWQRGKSAPSASFSVPNGEITALRFSRDTQSLFVGTSNGTLHKYDLRQRRLTRTINPDLGQISAIEQSSDGRVFVLGSPSGEIVVVDANQGTRINGQETNSGSVLLLELVKNDTHAIVVTTNKTVLKLDVKSGETTPLITTSNLITSAAFNKDRTRLALATSDGLISLYDLETVTEKGRLIGSGAISEDIVFGGTNYLLSRAQEGAVTLWAVENALPAPLSATPPAFYKPNNITLTQDDGLITAYDAIDNKKILDVAMPSSKLLELYVLDSGRHLYGTDNLGLIFRWSLEDGQSRAPLSVRSGGITDIKRGHSANTLLISYRTGHIVLLNEQNTQEITELRIHSLPIIQSNIDPTGRYAVSASEDDTAKILNANDLSVIQTIGSTSDVIFAKFSPNGDYLISAARDGALKISDIKTGLPVDEFEVGAMIRSVLISPDNQSIYIETQATDWVKWRLTPLMTYMMTETVDTDAARQRAENDILGLGRRSMQRCLSETERAFFALNKSQPCWCSNTIAPIVNQERFCPTLDGQGTANMPPSQFLGGSAMSKLLRRDDRFDDVNLEPSTLISTWVSPDISPLQSATLTETTTGVELDEETRPTERCDKAPQKGLSGKTRSYLTFPDIGIMVIIDDRCASQMIAMQTYLASPQKVTSIDMPSGAPVVPVPYQVPDPSKNRNQDQSDHETSESLDSIPGNVTLTIRGPIHIL